MKKKWLISIILVSLFLVAFFLIFYLNKNEEENLSLKYSTQDLCSLIYNDKLLYFDNLNKSFKINELTNEEISEYIYYKYEQYFDNTNLNTLSGKEVMDYLYQIFGKNIKYVHTSLHYNEELKKYHILYDEEKDIYYKNFDYENTFKNNIFAYINCSCNNETDSYVVTMKNMYTIKDNNKYDALYGNYIDAINNQNKLFDISNYEISTDLKNQKEEINNIMKEKYEIFKDRITEYKYIFKVDENNNIYFYSYEIN